MSIEQFHQGLKIMMLTLMLLKILGTTLKWWQHSYSLRNLHHLTQPGHPHMEVSIRRGSMALLSKSIILINMELYVEWDTGLIR